MTLMEFYKAYRSAEISSEKLTELFLERISDLNSEYRAVLEINPDALLIARERDVEAKLGKFRGDLHGAPILIKGNIDTADKMETTAGAMAFRGNRPTKDAFLVKKLRKAGAVILGKANLTELANFVSFEMPNGYSTLGGQTKNARGDFDPGGSSSGSAVGVALDMCLAAVGTETSGSILSPSSSNGVIGHKPTTGTISRSGIIPISFTQDTAGPIAKTVEDAFILFGKMIGYDENDPSTGISKSYTPVLRRIDSYKGMKFGYSEQFLRDLSSGHIEIFEKSLRNVESLGGKVLRISFPHLSEIMNIDVLFYEFPKAISNYLKDKNLAVKSLDDIIRFNHKHEDAIRYGQSILVKSSSYNMNDPEYLKSLLNDRKYSRRSGIDLVMSENDLDAILFPANYGALIAAKAGYPSITVPTGFSEKFGPFGLTFSGGFLEDEKLYSLANLYFLKFSRKLISDLNW